MRADKARNREAVLAAAEQLFARATDPDEVSMDAVAAAAGVGKGTIFRGFGDRRGLIQALYDEQVARELAADPAESAAELLTRVWTFKHRHRGLTLALEREGHGSPYANAAYARLHAELTAHVTRARGPADAPFLAHALLAAVRSDLVEHLRTHPDVDPIAGLHALTHHILGTAPDHPRSEAGRTSRPVSH
ncbi:TetR/AcrR family transcriptional regulator [Catenuloplanes atrovinosus]|uniref:AcrR family transcriptional regulator n=1 Tax=Catenuloplanes atrovinosus TaxID=137266 RepID=A0AAE3YPX9_9ACTN|nr:TetR family transcriptional regulator [Catenuloplanes atrovinosus]MDR7277102.1 AcrR family transcriptional regulator [Catenuloplanes atrovinosus]